jgi:hypothetical protein
MTVLFNNNKERSSGLVDTAALLFCSLSAESERVAALLSLYVSTSAFGSIVSFMDTLKICIARKRGLGNIIFKSVRSKFVDNSHFRGMLLIKFFNDLQMSRILHRTYIHSTHTHTVL